ncbi:ABC transporter ATP-binding protein [Oceanirhabdus sp. W0125-5]|uniref:ABC transporter ATP-binding protein n=1 Tax=Oceanirhabdus sp. W0125-5 TaxID=2999116 RepID=UPI0022F307D0|nr:ABC transporter ATP-binding protein [Oceanirhabdus sp. W0125-5]WBW95123.1 ABC transporter ATP-binding protein [Oceanirhabdus sp. W0125-5]
MENNCILEVNNLSKTYTKGKKEIIKAVDNISFRAYKGEILGLLGANGAGKTTTVKMICSLVKASEGTVLIDGIDNFKKRSKALKKISAVLEGNRNIYWKLTVRENLEFFSALKGIDPKKIQDKIDYYINIFNLKEKEKVIASKLSRGMQQKLAIATALISEAEVILLDEPTLGLDVKASYDIRRMLTEIVKKENKTIILTTHDMNVVEDVCDRVIIVDHGRIIAEDKIENLMRLFNVKSYNFVIEGNLSENQKLELSKINHLEIKESSESTEILINLEDNQLFYKVMSTFGSENSVIKTIESKELNFEEVFIKILGRSKKDEYVDIA